MREVNWWIGWKAKANLSGKNQDKGKGFLWKCIDFPKETIKSSFDEDEREEDELVEVKEKERDKEEEVEGEQSNGWLGRIWTIVDRNGDEMRRLKLVHDDDI